MKEVQVTVDSKGRACVTHEMPLSDYAVRSAKALECLLDFLLDDESGFENLLRWNDQTRWGIFDIVRFEAREMSVLFDVMAGHEYAQGFAAASQQNSPHDTSSVLIHQFAFFDLLHHRELKSQAVVPLHALDPLSHLAPLRLDEKVSTYFRTGQSHEKSPENSGLSVCSHPTGDKAPNLSAVVFCREMIRLIAA